LLGRKIRIQIENNIITEIDAENLGLDFLAYGFNNQSIGNVVLGLLSRNLPVRGVEAARFSPRVPSRPPDLVFT